MNSKEAVERMKTIKRLITVFKRTKATTSKKLIVVYKKEAKELSEEFELRCKEIKNILESL